QNIPVRFEEGRKIRQAVIPQDEDWVIFASDYSQIELRVLAHISGDERLSEAFNEDKDIHTQTAMDVFQVDRDDVDGDMRRQAQDYIDQYVAIYPKVKEYMDSIVKEAKHQGFVTTIMNRRRYLPDITSRNFNQRSFAERTAMNTPIQGSAADIIKKAMIDLQRE